MNSQRSDAKKINLIEESKKKKMVLMKLLSVMKLLIIVYNRKYGIYKNEIILFKVQKRY